MSSQGSSPLSCSPASGRGKADPQQRATVPSSIKTHSIDRCLQQTSKFPIIGSISAVSTWLWLKLPGSVCVVRPELHCQELSHPGDPQGDQVGLSPNGTDSSMFPYPCTSWHVRQALCSPQESRPLPERQASWHHEKHSHNISVSL